MNKLLNVCHRTLVGLLLLAGVQVAHAEIAVITHPGVKEIGISREAVANMYLDKKKTYTDGSRVNPVDQPSGMPARDKFYRAVLRMSDSEVNRYWSKIKFTGKGKPPRVIAGDEAVKNWVAANPGAIGYIDGKFLDKSVKVVLIIP